ncbi:MAG: LysR substrate-binding domain-containing protein [Anaerolineales bacterium]
MLDLHKLAVFVAAAEHGTYTEAGRRLHLSQSAVSQAIHGLEGQFGVRLFTQQGRTVGLTETGEALLPAARDLLEASRQVTDMLNHHQSQVAGELVVGCSTTPGKYLLPGLLAAFRRAYPLVRIRLDILGREDVLSRVLEEQLALAVVSTRVEGGLLEYQPLCQDRVILIVPADHPWGAFGQALPEDLLDLPLILREPGSGTRAVLLEGLACFGLTAARLNVVMEVSNSEAIEVAVEEGIGGAFVSETAAVRGLALGRVKQVGVAGLDLRREIFVARKVNGSLTRAQELLWAFVAERRQLDWPPAGCDLRPACAEPACPAAVEERCR